MFYLFYETAGNLFLIIALLENLPSADKDDEREREREREMK